MPGVRTSYSLDDPLGVGAGAAAVDPRPAGVAARSVWWPRIAVLPQRRVEQQALPVAVLGDVADAALAPLRVDQRGDVAAAERDRAGWPARSAHDRLDQLGLAVALDAGDAERPRRAWMVERDVVDDRAGRRRRGR